MSQENNYVDKANEEEENEEEKKNQQEDGPPQPDKSHTDTAQEEEQVIKKKYGGLLPKKPPLISKDHERAFFDSADWALGKQQAAQKPKGPLEALRPKLQPTPHQLLHSRLSTYAPTKNSNDEANTITTDDHGVSDSNHDQANAHDERNCDVAAAST